MNRHGLMRRGGWLWIVVPSVLAFAILGGFAQNAEGPNARDTPASNVLYTIAGFVLIGLALELIVREVILWRRNHPRRPPESMPMPVPGLMSPGGSGPTSTSYHRPAPRPVHQRHHWAGAVWMCLMLLLSGGLSGSFVVDGIQKQIVRHSSSTVATLATVERNSAHCSRGCTYTSYVSLDINGKTYSDVYVDDDETRAVGDTFDLLVDRNDPSSNDLPSDHGFAQLIGGGIALAFVLLLATALIANGLSSPRRRGHPGMQGGVPEFGGQVR